ncbi:bifunctional diaminohydroxyphosphoribosylaminopyrimidine deaminase/5-amino-6-(5-phosphoribosylamino)uracil reductase RibD [Arthrobacter sp. NamB2]|uniref:bifunctional diaminohydroxyphosphoribosylaminopyrimidine deaminase/5-amino-6-(5-phosphoribosylamino)uracil reductase RibD n=1 Tax=Arthrobacter sp. NamB2 TaxID=2576035 RepID=UPI0010C9F2BF|nr:bifunctional diaminohydroxyphosphoribosylaminopyrimidine deaminase/5-amino-6-(5-phosphoribosylamino)uracil reductase RibD [Arthrobacter sp. NamB2]TKV28099.1 bifunctional diaminohydroxyphosphoribosylaminopyrimidine deaminase/5-amino-6-(5-phosphoribosylamino)uracil reductase RibD [Arthrobacter sp. NamB2]
MSTPTPISGAEAAAMLHALDLAGRGVRGANPLVGAVVLSADGAILGEGYHRGAGTMHAEPAALADTRSRGNDPRGATMVVTLEPCNHTGRTGPCSEALIDAGAARVVYAAADINGAAAGGARRLREAGIPCVGGVEAALSYQLNERWSAALIAQRPFVTLKSAQSLDGRVAAADGSSQWITGAEARADGHRIRALADAVLVGTGTVLADNPRLTARDIDRDTPAGAGRAGLRVVMGRTPVPEGAAIRGEGFLHLPTRDVHAVLGELYGRGVRHLLVEGGPRIASAFLQAGVVDELVSFVAPLVLGDGAPAFPELGVATLDHAIRWMLDDAGGPGVQQLGADVRLHLRPPPSAP